MARALLANNAATSLSAAITSTTATTFNVTSGASFPAPTGSQYFWCTLLDSANVPEIFKVTGNASNVFTVVRAQDGTTASTFLSGAAVEMKITAGLINELAALTDGLPTGAVFYRASNNVPTGTLLCDGSAVSRTTYAALFAETGTAFGAGDGSTTFNIPDLRGEFIRGLDNSRGVDGSRVLGSSQPQAIQVHDHDLEVRTDSGALTGSASGGAGPQGVVSGGVWGRTNTYTARSPTGANAGGAALGPETRPRNVAMPAFIKY